LESKKAQRLTIGWPVENSSTLVILAVVMAIVELIAGGAIGWWLRGGQVSKVLGANEEVQRARSALSKLHELATSVAADVGEHSSRVQAISSELAHHAEDGLLEAAVLGTVAQIIEANERLQQQLKIAEVKLQEQAHQIEVHAADAMTDALTGASNRRLFDAELAQRLAEWHRKQTPFCLMMIDVDHFKTLTAIWRATRCSAASPSAFARRCERWISSPVMAAKSLP
jgi:hypothetical protein